MIAMETGHHGNRRNNRRYRKQMRRENRLERKRNHRREQNERRNHRHSEFLPFDDIVSPRSHSHGLPPLINPFQNMLGHGQGSKIFIKFMPCIYLIYCQTTSDAMPFLRKIRFNGKSMGVHFQAIFDPRK